MRTVKHSWEMGAQRKAAALVAAWSLIGVSGCADLAGLEPDSEIGVTEAYSSAVDETTFTFADWDGANTTSTCIATGAGSCTTIGTEPNTGNPGSNAICEGSSNAAGCDNGFSGCVFERSDATYTPTVDGRVCRIDFQMDSRTVSGADIASHYLTVTQGATSVFDPAGTFDIDATYQTRFGSFTMTELDAAGIDRSGSTLLTFGARTADCAPSNPAPITWRVDNLLVTVVKDLDDDGTCDDLQASVCSNAITEPGEICDDGNLQSGDGCSADCSFVDNLPNGADCSANGDLDCASRLCDTTETLDTCEAANVCGNGRVEGAEACDDGNVAPGDGCSADCSAADSLPNGAGCTANQQCASGLCDTIGDKVCESVNSCGNGLLEAGEDCDDGNVLAYDGCGESCVFDGEWRGGGGCSARANASDQGLGWLVALLALGIARRPGRSLRRP